MRDPELNQHRTRFQSNNTEGRASLAGAIAAFDRLSQHANDNAPQSLVTFFLTETAFLLRKVEAGDVVTEDDWLNSFESAALIVCESQRGGLDAEASD